MARFLRSMLLALAVLLVAVWGLGYVLTRYPVFAHDVLGYPKEWVRVSMRISSSRDGVPTDTLYIGDSVGGQLRPYDGGRSLTSNGSILPVGNYLLVEHALNSRPGIRVVEYISVPQVIGHKFERPRTCNNFLKPFLTLDHRRSLDRTIYDRLDARPRSYAYFLPPMKVLPFAEINMEDGVAKDPTLLSDLSIHWLVRLDSLCKAHGAELILRSPPVAERMYHTSADWKAMRDQVHQARLDGLFDPYFRSIRYLPDSLLRDNIHWKNDFVAVHRAQMVRLMESPQ